MHFSGEKIIHLLTDPDEITNVYVKFLKNVMFFFNVISKKVFFNLYIMYFLLYNPNLKSVFWDRTYKYVFFYIKYPE